MQVAACPRNQLFLQQVGLPSPAIDKLERRAVFEKRVVVPIFIDL